MRVRLKQKYEDCRKLRREEGLSVKSIAKKLDISKSTCSVWVRDIKLTLEQKAVLKGHESEGWKRAIEKVKADKERRWKSYREEAEAEWPELSKNPAFMFGLALYVGEGAKSQPTDLCIANVDPNTIRKAKEFFLLIGVPEERLVIHIHLHDKANVAEAEKFWPETLNLSKESLRKTTIAVSRASKKLSKRVYPMGVCHLNANSTYLKQKLLRWMELALQ